MAIEKLSEFAKDGQKNTDDLTLTDGFPVSKKPARQWFNWLFNTLTLKINEIIDGKIDGSSIVDDLTTDDATKPVSAKQAKNLQDNKLDKTENAVSATKLKATRIISFSGGATGSFNFDGSGNSSCILTLANSGVVASTYGSSLKIPVLTVNAKGLITGVSEQQIPIIDDLTTGGSTKLLSAGQGKVLNDQAFGVGQTWMDVFSSRVIGTTYTNTTGKPIMVVIWQAYDSAPSLYIDNIKIAEIDGSPGSVAASMSAVVPNGSTYRVSKSINGWVELR